MNSMHKFNKVACLVLAGLLIGCSSTSEFYLSPDFEDEKVESSVLILPVEQSQFESFFGHRFGSLSIDQKRTFHSDVESMYRRYAGTNVHVNREEEIDNDAFEEKNLEVDDQTIEVLIPRSDSRLMFENVDPRFILLLDQYQFSRGRDVSEKSTYAGHEVEIQYSLTFETKYVYWDTDRKEAVGWGIARGNKALESEQVQEEDYAEVLQQAIRKIALQGPVPANP